MPLLETVSTADPMYLARLEQWRIIRRMFEHQLPAYVSTPAAQRADFEAADTLFGELADFCRTYARPLSQCDQSESK